MTVVATTASRTGRARRGVLKGLASFLAFLCLVLFLLAVEQKQAVAAWDAVRHGAAPAVARAGGWLADGAADGIDGLRAAVAAPDAPLAAAGEDMVLAGEFGPADQATRDAIGGAAFVAARIRLESGETFQTRPLRIAAARESFIFDQTFAERWNALADAQIELRQVVPADGARAVPASPLCGGEAPGAVALLHRRDRVELMLFRAGAQIGADTPASAVCGVWSFERR